MMPWQMARDLIRVREAELSRRARASAARYRPDSDDGGRVRVYRRYWGAVLRWTARERRSRSVQPDARHQRRGRWGAGASRMARTTDPAAPMTVAEVPSAEARTVTGAHSDVMARSAISRETGSASQGASGA
jgi:hypothetical protein